MTMRWVGDRASVGSTGRQSLLRKCRTLFRKCGALLCIDRAFSGKLWGGYNE